MSDPNEVLPNVCPECQTIYDVNQSECPTCKENSIETTIRMLLDDAIGPRTCIDDHKGWKDDCHQCTAQSAKCEVVAIVAEMLSKGFLAELPGVVDCAMGLWVSQSIPAKEYQGLKTQTVEGVRLLLEQTLHWDYPLKHIAQRVMVAKDSLHSDGNEMEHISL